jgi:hypothetical protein
VLGSKSEIRQRREMARHGYMVPRNTAHRNGTLLSAKGFLGALKKVRQRQRLSFSSFLGLQNRLPRFNSGRGLHSGNQSLSRDRRSENSKEKRGLVTRW